MLYLSWQFNLFARRSNGDRRAGRSQESDFTITAFRIAVDRTIELSINNYYEIEVVFV